MSSVPFDDATGGSGPDRPEPDWTALTGHVDPDDPLLLERLGVVVPDDARALDADRRALLDAAPDASAWRHLRARARRAAGGLHNATLGAVVVSLSLLAATVALAAGLVGVMTPQPDTTRPGAYALAELPPGAPGQVGGLLPDAGVTLANGTGVATRDLRPAVLFVPPAATCAACADELGALRRQAREYGLRVYVVAPVDGAELARSLVKDSPADTVHLLTDGSGALLAAYGADVAQAVLVHADGVVGGVLRNPSQDGRFEQLLSPLRFPGAPPSLQAAAATH